MSNLYATATNEKGSTRTLTAAHDVTVTAQSWSGSVQVSMIHQSDGSSPLVEVFALPGSTTDDHGARSFLPHDTRVADLLEGFAYVPAVRVGTSGTGFTYIALQSKALPHCHGEVLGSIILALLFNSDGSAREFVTWWQNVETGATEAGHYYTLASGAAAYADFDERS